MTFKEKEEKAKGFMEKTIRGCREEDQGHTVFFARMENMTVCQISTKHYSWVGQSLCARDDKFSEIIGKCIAISYARYSSIPDWLKESPVEVVEKKTKWVFNPKKYLEFCTKHMMAPSFVWQNLDWNAGYGQRNRGYRNTFFDEVEA